MPRALVWTHFQCLPFSLAQCSVYLHPVSFWLSCPLSSSSASSWLLLLGLILTLSLNVCAPPSLGVV